MLQPTSVQKVNDAARHPFSVTGIVFPEESEYRSQKNGAGWLFLATRRGLANEKPGADETRLIRGERAGKDDTFSRLPVALSLLTKRLLSSAAGRSEASRASKWLAPAWARLRFLISTRFSPAKACGGLWAESFGEAARQSLLRTSSRQTIRGRRREP